MTDDKQLQDSQLIYAKTQADEVVDIATRSLISSLPWLQESVVAVLGGMSMTRKLDRIKEVIDGMGHDLQGFQSDTSESYVKTEDFQDLLEKTLKQAADERNEDKRRIYKDFLVGSVKAPGQPYDEQVTVLHQLQEVQLAHIRVLKAMAQTPQPTSSMMGSRRQTLQARLSNPPIANLDDLIGELNSLRLTNASGLTTTVTGHGAEDLQSMVTAQGQRLLRYILEA